MRCQPCGSWALLGFLRDFPGVLTVTHGGGVGEGGSFWEHFALLSAGWDLLSLPTSFMQEMGVGVGWGGVNSSLLGGPSGRWLPLSPIELKMWDTPCHLFSVFSENSGKIR